MKKRIIDKIWQKLHEKYDICALPSYVISAILTGKNDPVIYPKSNGWYRLEINGEWWEFGNGCIDAVYDQLDQLNTIKEELDAMVRRVVILYQEIELIEKHLGTLLRRL